MSSQSDQRFMREALRLARKGLGRTSPNPVVGAVLVRSGHIIASGYHKRAGGSHAEVQTLADVGFRARKGDILYVTLEPCHHQGRTPPCTRAILSSGLKTVVVGIRDPNPKVPGGGCEFLAERGIEIRTGVLDSECRKLNEAYLKFITTDRPFVVVKSALTMDGWTATSTGHAQWITNERSRKFVHRLRDRIDGVMVGIGTVLADDPLLTTRLGSRRGKDPIRIIVDTHFRIPENARVLSPDHPAKTLIAVGNEVKLERIEGFQRKGVSIVRCPIKGAGIDLGDLMESLGAMGITSVLVEGGSGIIGSMIREKQVDKFYIFKAPKILGGNDGIPMATGPGPEAMNECLVLKDVKVRRFGDDILIRAYPDY